jgi:hypothetical protein
MNKIVKRLWWKFKKFRRKYNSNWNIFVVCIAIVMIWRWLWNLLDMYVFPNYPLLSDLICICIGVGILLVDDWKLWELQEEDPHKGKFMK